MTLTHRVSQRAELNRRLQRCFGFVGTLIKVLRSVVESIECQLGFRENMRHV